MENSSEFIAHKNETNNSVQLLSVHLHNTALLAEEYAGVFGCGDLAKSIALLHDIGKYSEKFQQRIHGENVSVDHSSAGGQLALEVSKNTLLGYMAAYCIFGHHAGLPNGGKSNDNVTDSTFHARRKKSVEDYSAYKQEIKLQEIDLPQQSIETSFDAYFLIRMLFSSLVDADYLDTEKFFSEVKRGKCTNFNELNTIFYEKVLKEFLYPTLPVSPLNQHRTELLKDCLLASEEEQGLFTLTAPTGSGKTIASMAFALSHAAKRDKKRIIYVIPYNTIIEQNAFVFENALGESNILQHHSNVEYDDKNEESSIKRLATENWDYPIIVTSNVQFFESLYSNRSSGCRKLHNIANSIIIFDEAQMIPTSYLRPCVRVIRELVENYKCTAVLATATQSSLEEMFMPLKAKEIARNPQELYSFLRRTKIVRSKELFSKERLIDELSNKHQVLCIVNRRSTAQEIFFELEKIKKEGIYHLSTLMYPLHRTRVLNEIRERLKNKLSCIVISTSLVECGVDVDFPVVYREEAGLDSIIQAAGRCNREGNITADSSFTFVFAFEDCKAPRSIQANVSAMKQSTRNREDIASLEVIDGYFKQLYYNKGDSSLDAKSVLDKIEKSGSSFAYPFKDISEEFKLIETPTSIVYMLKEAPDLREELVIGKRNREIFRKLGKYGITIYREQLKENLSQGIIECLDDGVLLLNEDYYNEKYGLLNSPIGGQVLIDE